MNFFKIADWKKLPIVKIIGIGALLLIGLTIVLWLLGFAVRTAFFGAENTPKAFLSNGAPGAPTAQYRGGIAKGNMALEDFVISPPRPEPGVSTGVEAEDFEVKEFYVSVRTRKLDEKCAIIENLKPRDDVIFENTNRYDRGCSYVFKVKNKSADSVTKIVKSLKPDVFRENIYTIKQSVKRYDDEITIQEKKLVSVEKTLTDASSAYDEVSRLATEVRDAESLAKIIDSKLNLINRLAQERITIKERIDRLTEQKDEQLDRLNFTFFTIDMSEIRIIDLKAIKDSWTAEVQQFVREFNSVIQGITVNLVSFLLRFAQAAIYFLLALFIIKYGWRFTKKIWRL
jgi:hypothetical protein